MAAGPADGWYLGINWSGVPFTDESANINAGVGVSITRGRGSEADDMQPGVLTVLMDNVDGRYSPDSPLSALYPNIKDGAATQFSVTRDGVTSWRHQGKLVVGAPDTPAGDPAASSVEFQSTDLLGSLSQQTLRSDYVEQWVNASETVDLDLWDFPPAALLGSLRGIGSVPGVARMVYPLTRVGTAESITPDGILLESAISVTAQNFVGPVIECRSAVDPGLVAVVSFSFRTAERTTLGGPSKWIAFARDNTDQVLWSLRLVDNGGQTDLNFYDGSGTNLSTVLAFAPGSGSTDPGDDQWYNVRLYSYGGGANTGYVLTRVADGEVIKNVATSIDTTYTNELILGGALPAAAPGKQTSCVTAQFGCAVISATNYNFTEFLSTVTTRTAQERFSDFNLYGNYAHTINGTDDRTVALRPSLGRTVFDCVAELARTVGAVVVADRVPSPALNIFMADATRLPTVALTVDGDLDLDATGGLPRRKGDVPSIVTATYPGGQETYTSAYAAAMASDGSIDTCAADATQALSIAAARANSSRRLRYGPFQVDLSTASNDLWSAMMALEIGDRIRLVLGDAGDTLVTQDGWTYVDVYAVQWTEYYTQERAFWVIDTVPADDPVEAQVGTGERTRVYGIGSVSSGTAVGTTATGTIVVDTSSSVPWTTDAAAYPTDLDWNGERVSVTAPGGGTSPQTFTITARGVAPSVARVHSASEPITPWLPAAVAF